MRRLSASGNDRHRCVRSLLSSVAISLGAAFCSAAEKPSADYESLIRTDKPVAHWRFSSGDSTATVASTGSAKLPHLQGTGKIELKVAGPRPSEFGLFRDDNNAVDLVGGAYFRLSDPGVKSTLDFDKGDSITLEAWVNVRKMSQGFGYVIGKGRTQNKGFARDNQNYALRLSRAGSGAGITFLFRSAGKDADWHRWTSSGTMGIGDGWHHVAVTYTFGKADSLRGYIDGEAVKGKWDMGGKTDRAPVVDDDELWIGSSMGGSGTSSLNGQIDEVAIYRAALSPERIAARFQFEGKQLPPGPLRQLTQDRVRVEIFERIADKTSWRFRRAEFVEDFELPAFAVFDVPKKYSKDAIRVDRSNPFLIRVWGKVRIPKQTERILLRSRNASRLFVDGTQIVSTGFHSISSSAHGTVFPINTSLAPNIRPVPRGDTEKVAPFEGDGNEHLVLLEMIVGGRGHRPELGETEICTATAKGDFRVLSNTLDTLLTDEAWPRLVAQQRIAVAELNQQNRQMSDRERAADWKARHRLARAQILKTSKMPIHGSIDEYVDAKLAHSDEKPTAAVDDLAFLRRVSLDVVGQIPTETEVAAFLADKNPGRRSRIIDRLLASPEWADHWVGYWQDVLAENPNIIKPTLNNSGPFRWWIHESFQDNKPFDRFATELIMMEGSEYAGGPAGFAIATQNDVPMAAKAHVIGQAFLAIEMKCARCHDAPFHDVMQEDLFALAAMLKRGPQVVPATSSIPGGAAVAESLLVEVTLKPGQSIAPSWGFDDLVPDDVAHSGLAAPQDTRAQLAALVTSPENERFAEVIVNRLWHRYIGRGIAEPVDDWQDADTSHPELLAFLAREFVLNGYDLKHIARLILNSQTYQRVARGRDEIKLDGYLFGSPLVRRMTAEQLVDSLFAASGKDFDAGQMSLDIDGAMKLGTATHLGYPKRAWEFASTANERDRPSLSLPLAQPFVTLMQTFGWRSSRQNPLTIREEAVTALQPAALLNGVLARRLTRISDDSSLLAMAIQSTSTDELIDRIYLRMLTRRPSETERKLFVELLQPGFSERVNQNPAPVTKTPTVRRDQVSWSNHLSPQANEIKTALAEVVQAGDTPTNRLENEWRERFEDAIWVLLNSPEFVFVP